MTPTCFGKNIAILREQLGSFLSNINVNIDVDVTQKENQLLPEDGIVFAETCRSHGINKEAYNLVHLLVNLYILGTGFLRVSPVRVFQEMLCADLHLKTPVTGRTNERSLVTLKKQCFLRSWVALDRPVLQFCL
jgi:hypothetical protein